MYIVRLFFAFAFEWIAPNSSIAFHFAIKIMKIENCHTAHANVQQCKLLWNCKDEMKLNHRKNEILLQMDDKNAKDSLTMRFIGMCGVENPLIFEQCYSVIIFVCAFNSYEHFWFQFGADAVAASVFELFICAEWRWKSTFAFNFTSVHVYRIGFKQYCQIENLLNRLKLYAHILAISSHSGRMNKNERRKIANEFLSFSLI